MSVPTAIAADRRAPREASFGLFPPDFPSCLLSSPHPKAYNDSRVPGAQAQRPLIRNHMPPVSIFLNIAWLVLGGLWMAFGWVVAAVIMAITIIGLPWARAAFNIAAYTYCRSVRGPCAAML
jgi:hypothetical protein